MHSFIDDERFRGIKPLQKRAHLTIATPHKVYEMKYIEECYKENYLTIAGGNVNALEETVAEFMSTSVGDKRAVALGNGSSAIHLAVKLAADKIYWSSTEIFTHSGKGAGGVLYGK